MNYKFVSNYHGVKYVVDILEIVITYIVSIHFLSDIIIIFQRKNFYIAKRKILIPGYTRKQKINILYLESCYDLY